MSAELAIRAALLAVVVIGFATAARDMLRAPAVWKSIGKPVEEDAPCE